MSKAIEYSLGRYQIRINLWFLIIFLLVQTLLNELGFWQLKRANEKQQRLIQMEQGVQQTLNSLNGIGEKEVSQFQAVELQLQLVSHETLLLDNKIHNRLPGYHVLNIAQDLVSGKYILVNRGWLFAGNDRETMPQVELPKSPWKVSARIYPIADQAISTEAAKIEVFSNFVRLPVLDANIVKSIESRFNKNLLPYSLRLNRESQAALEIDWIWTNMPVEKHLAYAFQWFALAFAFLVISLIVSIKKR